MYFGLIVLYHNCFSTFVLRATFINLAIFGSGQGSNAENLCSYFLRSSKIKIVCVCTNKKEAYIVTPSGMKICDLGCSKK